MADTPFFVGGEGWEHPEWRDVFYPEDLPEDWRLAYYALHYSAVLVPHPVWTAASPDTLAAWIADTPPHFRFLLAGGAQTPGDAMPAAARALGARFAGGMAGRVPGPGALLRVIWLSEAGKLRELARRLEAARGAPVPVFLIEDQHDLKRLREAATLLEIMGLSAGPLLV